MNEASRFLEGSGNGMNQSITVEEGRKIRALGDFDLVMLISEIHDHSWPDARKILNLMAAA